MSTIRLETSYGQPRKRRNWPGGGFLLVCAVYASLGLAALWVAGAPGPERLWQSWHSLRSGRISTLSPEDLAQWREALAQQPKLAQTLNPAPLSIVSPHRAGLIESDSVWLLRSGQAGLNLSLEGETQSANFQLRGYAKPGAGPDWERQGQLMPGQALSLSLPAAKAGELIELRFERRLRARLELPGADSRPERKAS